MADPRIKQLKIKTGVVKRTTREKNLYETEAEQIKEKIKQMQNEGQEVYYIKKQDDLLQETVNVIADCQRRLNNYYLELKTLLDNETELAKSEEYKLAKEVFDVATKEVTI